MNARKSRPDVGAAESESSSTIIKSRITSGPKKTPEERRAWRMANFPQDVVILLECDQRRHEAEARYGTRLS